MSITSRSGRGPVSIRTVAALKATSFVSSSSRTSFRLSVATAM
jgi:hypothetical protein